MTATVTVLAVSPGTGADHVATFPSVGDAVIAAIGLRDADPTACMAIDVGEFTAGDSSADEFMPRVVALRVTARPGQILLSELARALLGERSRYALVKVGDAYELTVTEQRVALPLSLPPTGGSEFIGRDEELNVLLDQWELASRGEARLLLIEGEPGIGKTRLAAELARRVHGDGALVLYGRCDDVLHVAYQPFVEAIGAYARVAGSAPTLARVTVGAGHLGLLIPVLRDNAELPAPVRAEAETEQLLLFQAVGDLLTSLAREVPTLLLIDDLHWATRATLLLLSHVAASVSGHLLVVATARDAAVDLSEATARLLDELPPPIRRMKLAGLGADSVAELVSATTSADISLANDVYAVTDGNPFFVGEILRHVTEVGSLAVPQAVADVVIGRMGRLTDECVHALMTGAVIGPVFERDVLSAVIGDADASMAEAAGAGMISARPNGDEYAFTHSIFRQVVVANTSGARLARLHRSVGEAIEARPGLSRRRGRLADHFAGAAPVGEVDKALDYAVAAADDAVAHLAYDAAVAYAARALAILDGGDTRDPTRRAALNLALSRANEFAGNVVAMKSAAVAAASDAREASDVAAMAEAATLYGRWVTLGQTDETVPSLCDAALDAGVDNAWRARLLATLANYRVNAESRDCDDAAALAEESMSLARSLGDNDTWASAALTRAIALIGSDRFEERVRLTDELVALAEPTDAKARLDALVIRATTRLELADIDGFRADVAALADLGERLQWWAARFFVASFSTTFKVMQGDLDEAEADAEAQLRAGSGDANAANTYAVQLFSIRREQGRLGELEPLIAATVTATPGIVAFRATWALALTELDRVDEARAHLIDLAADQYKAVPRDAEFLITVCLLAEVAALLGDADTSSTLLNLLAPHAGHLAVGARGTISLGAVDRFTGMLASTTGDTDRAAASFEAALALERSIPAPAMVARTTRWCAGG